MAFNKTDPSQSNNALEDIDQIRLNTVALLELSHSAAVSPPFGDALTAYMLWLKDDVGTNGELMIRNAANDAWISLLAIDIPGIPSGTKMVFFQASAPTGWTQDVTHTDKMLRVVSGVGGGSGGTESPIAAHVHATSGHTLSGAEMPSHNHNIKTFGGSGSGAHTCIDATLVDRDNFVGVVTINEGGGGSHAHGDTGSLSSPKYIDVIVAVKD